MTTMPTIGHSKVTDPRPRTPTSGVLIELLFMMSVGAAATLSALAVSLGARKNEHDARSQDASSEPDERGDDDA